MPRVVGHVQKQPLGEVFGFPITNVGPDAAYYRQHHLCSFNNKSPNCTKDKVDDPLGVCSVLHAGEAVVTCPVRFRQDWLVVRDAAAFFFPGSNQWTALTEVKLTDGSGKSAGNIDLVLVQYDSKGQVQDFGALEVQAVYISGTIRTAFEHYMSNPVVGATMDWSRQRNYPRPDFLSSSRKRLVPQLMYKGSILHSWGKRQAVVVDRAFFASLPPLSGVAVEEAEIAWFVYELAHNTSNDRYQLRLDKTVYTAFDSSLQQLSVAKAPPVDKFLKLLQKRLDDARVGARSANVTQLMDALTPTEYPVDPDEV